MALGNRVREARIRRGLTQDQLAKRAGMSQAAIHNLEKRDSQSSRFIMELAQALAVSPEWLRTGEGMRDIGRDSQNNRSSFSGALSRGSELSELVSMDVWDSQTPTTPDEIELPLFREVELSVGSGVTQVVESDGVKLRFSRAELARAGVDERHAAYAYVTGDSNKSVLHDGARVAIDTSDRKIRDGKLYALDQEGMLRVRVIDRIPGGIRLKSFNSEYPDEDYRSEYVDKNIRILGRVFWYDSFI